MKKDAKRSPEAILYDALLHAVADVEDIFEDVVVDLDTELETFLATTMRLQAMQMAMRQTLKASLKEPGYARILDMEEDCLKVSLTYMLTGDKLSPEEALELCPDLDVRGIALAKKEARPGGSNLGAGTLTTEQVDEVLKILDQALPK